MISVIASSTVLKKDYGILVGPRKLIMPGCRLKSTDVTSNIDGSLACHLIINQAGNN